MNFVHILNQRIESCHVVDVHLISLESFGYWQALDRRHSWIESYSGNNTGLRCSVWMDDIHKIFSRMLESSSLYLYQSYDRILSQEAHNLDVILTLL